MNNISTTLAALERPGTFAVRRSVDAADLQIEVRGVGHLKLPVSAAQARKLCAVARPARYGLRDRTLLDRRVRDGWEVARSRVRIDRQRWNRTLQPELERIRSALGLPAGCELRAELHNLLVYGPGQFFAAHQDTEKRDGMIGSLVVTLPSTFKGGAMMVEHDGERLISRGSAKKLSLVAFYADCHHAVGPVQEGYRVALTYNLILVGDARAAVPSPAVDSIAHQLRAFFEKPVPPAGHGAEHGQSPNRLVYLLDHQYTEKNLDWPRLKNADALRAGALRDAARLLDCEVFLALADVHELWSCGDDQFGYGAHHDFFDDEDQEDGEFDAPGYADHPPLGDLVDDDVELRHFVGTGEPLPSARSTVSRRELCWTTPSVALDPFEAEYEPYMGNYGDTVDRWYHRAAVVLWPRERGFVIRAEASASWAVGALQRALRTGDRDSAQRMAAEVQPFWARTVLAGRSAALFREVLEAAAGLDDPDLAAKLLEPFTLDLLSPKAAPRFLVLLERYGASWCCSRLAGWAPEYLEEAQLAWLSSLPKLVRALVKRGGGDGLEVARWLVAERWHVVEAEARDAVRLLSPSLLSDVLARWNRPLLALLESAHLAEDPDLHAGMLDTLRDPAVHGSVLDLTRLLRAAQAEYSGASLDALALGALARQCRDELAALLAQPPRAADDWSIHLPADCSCELCRELRAFLERPGKTRLEWPLKKDWRAHVHQVIDRHELPVTHTTRRSGRPYTLVLEKTRALFRREEGERDAWRAELDWLDGADDRQPFDAGCS